MRTGKIARLPREIRDQLNQRLLDGQPGRRLVIWLNSLPEVKQVLATDFDGRPLNEQNLSDWKGGGYLDWEARLETLAQSRELAANSLELAAATDGKLTDHLSTMLSARYAVALAEWDKQTTGTFQDKLRTLHSLCQDIVKLRRSDHHATRLNFEVKRQKDEEEKTDMEILARFKEWASVEEVHDWICQDWDCPEERERQLMKYYGYEQPTAASPAPPAEDSPEAEEFSAAEPALNLKSSETPVPRTPGPAEAPVLRSLGEGGLPKGDGRRGIDEKELRAGGKANTTVKPARHWLDPGDPAPDLRFYDDPVHRSLREGGLRAGGKANQASKPQ
jgi:hypothetical protein